MWIEKDLMRKCELVGVGGGEMVMGLGDWRVLCECG